VIFGRKAYINKDESTCGEGENYAFWRSWIIFFEDLKVAISTFVEAFK
jgi:hypothetical protein